MKPERRSTTILSERYTSVKLRRPVLRAVEDPLNYRPSQDPRPAHSGSGIPRRKHRRVVVATILESVLLSA